MMIDMREDDKSVWLMDIPMGYVKSTQWNFYAVSVSGFPSSWVHM